MKTDRSTLGLYVHIPFCVKKCAYCDFYSQTDYTVSDAYLEALLTEAAMVSEKYRGRLIDTVYIGGGTPSLLSDTQAQKIMQTVKNSFCIMNDAEITVEASTLAEGDDILIMGETTGVVEQKAEGIVLNEQVVEGVKQGDVCSLKTSEVVRRGDKLYKEVVR